MNISIVIPTYRPKNYISTCLDAICSQRNDDGVINKIHVFIVLNGEKTPYYDYLHNLSQSKSSSFIEIELIYTEVKGVSNARNIGIERSVGYDFICFIDDDDIISESYINDLVVALECSKNRVAQSQRNYFTLSNNLPIYEKFQKTHKKQVSSRFAMRKYLNSVCGKVYPYELIKDRRFNTKISMSEDALFLFNLSPYISEMIIVDSAIYSLQRRNESVSRKKKSALSIMRDSFLYCRELTNDYFGNLAAMRGSFFLYISRILGNFKFVLYRLLGLN